MHIAGMWCPGKDNRKVSNQEVCILLIEVHLELSSNNWDITVGRKLNSQEAGRCKGGMSPYSVLHFISVVLAIHDMTGKIAPHISAC